MEKNLMATLTHTRTRRGSHLKLVRSQDDGRAMTVAPTGQLCDLDAPGPRDASALVTRFSRVLPSDADFGGVFSLGTE